MTTPEPSERDALRKKIMERMRPLCEHSSQWSGWPGTWEFAEAALQAIGAALQPSPSPVQPLNEHTRRWNIEPQDDGSMLVCRGEHDKHDACHFEPFVPSPSPAVVEPTDADALREIAAAGYSHGVKIQALIELVAADDAHKAWCLLQRLKPRPLFDPMGTSPPTYVDSPEREAIIARLNRAWEGARSALNPKRPEEGKS